jgi:hypothetical protein
VHYCSAHMSRRFVSLLLVLFALACVHLACGDDTCHSNDDCPASQDNQPNACFIPGITFCPVALGPSCTVDTDCNGGQVCNTNANGMGYVSTSCTAPCAGDSDCGPTFACGDGGPSAARTSAQCPTYYSFASGVCSIPACQHDADCVGGYCVNGVCGPSLGKCGAACS